MKLRRKQGYVLALVMVVTLILASVASLVAMNTVRNIQSDGGSFAQRKEQFAADGKLEQYLAQLSFAKEEKFDRNPDDEDANRDFPNEADKVLRKVIISPLQPASLTEEIQMIDQSYEKDWGLRLTITSGQYDGATRTFQYTVKAETVNPSGEPETTQVKAELQISFTHPVPEDGDDKYVVSFSGVDYLSYTYTND